jgi:hypothetical protein
MLYQQAHVQGVLQQPTRAPARCVVAAAAKKQKPKKRKTKQPISQRISYIEGKHFYPHVSPCKRQPFKWQLLQSFKGSPPAPVPVLTLVHTSPACCMLPVMFMQ